MIGKLLTTVVIATGVIGAMPPSTGCADERGQGSVEHVLLLSVDGFHTVDLEVCATAGTCPNLAKLTQHGITYTNASTTKPSDSFPGLLAQVTGGTSKSTGVFYDDSYLPREAIAPARRAPKRISRKISIRISTRSTAGSTPA